MFTGILVLWLKTMFSDTTKRQRFDLMSCSELLWQILIRSRDLWSVFTLKILHKDATFVNNCFSGITCTSLNFRKCSNYKTLMWRSLQNFVAFWRFILWLTLSDTVQTRKAATPCLLTGIRMLYFWTSLPVHQMLMAKALYLLLDPVCLKVQQGASCAGSLSLLWSWIFFLWKCTTKTRQTDTCCYLSTASQNADSLINLLVFLCASTVPIPKLSRLAAMFPTSLYHLNTRPQWAASFSAFCPDPPDAAIYVLSFSILIHIFKAKLYVYIPNIWPHYSQNPKPDQLESCSFHLLRYYISVFAALLRWTLQKEFSTLVTSNSTSPICIKSATDVAYVSFLRLLEGHDWKRMFWASLKIFYPWHSMSYSLYFSNLWPLVLLYLSAKI